MSNVMEVEFGSSTVIRTDPLYQYDYGQILKFTDLDLPTAYEVHFSNNNASGESITQIGDADGVSIPDNLLRTGLPVYAWIFLHTGSSDGETVYKATIPVIQRAEPSEDPPTPAEQSAISEAIEALNEAVEATADIRNMSATAETLPSGSSATASYADGLLTIGVPKGDKGDKGDKGNTGATGATGNGIASITLTSQVGNLDTYTILFTDGNSTTFTVTNGYAATLPTQAGTYELRAVKTNNGITYQWIKAMTLAE